MTDSMGSLVWNIIILIFWINKRQNLQCQRGQKSNEGSWVTTFQCGISFHSQEGAQRKKASSLKRSPYPIWGGMA